jgi:uncharacterized membrane protein (UPF0127 family)
MRGLAAALLAALLHSGIAAASCSEGRVDLRGGWGQASFEVEIADDSAERARGLMHREELDRWAGMLFIYERPQRVVFWMKNTPISLDMLFVDVSGTVTRIKRNAVPMSRAVIEGGDSVYAVLEINGGMAEELGVVEGTVLRHPRFDPAGAAWPCG